MEIEIDFPGGLKVDARFRGHTVRTDQSRRSGGDDSDPSPFDLFLASIAACSGFYALSFCRRRGIGVDGLNLTLRSVREPPDQRIARLVLDIAVPAAFPAKYRPALERAIDQYTVKRHILAPPEFETRWVD